MSLTAGGGVNRPLRQCRRTDQPGAHASTGARRARVPADAARDPRIDPARVGFLGSSQAGWIIPAALAAAVPGDARFAVVLSAPATSVGLEYAYSAATGDGIRPHDALSPEAIDARVDAYAGPQGFDHVPILRALKTPTLWLVGEDDESIPVRHTLRNLRAAIGAGAAITLRTYPGANQALAAAGGPVPYWTDVIDWLRKERILQ